MATKVFAILSVFVACLQAQPLITQTSHTNASIIEAVTMPNIGYLFRGYDIMKGNPLQVSGLPVDPGFQQPLFRASYESGSVTEDQRYLQPDGTSIMDCSGSCKLSFGSQEISGEKAYQESIERKASTDVEGWGAKFSASVDYKRVSESTSSYSNVFTHADASCCSYFAQTLTFTPPPLSPNFLAAVATMTEQYDEKIYQRIIKTFGTHFVNEAQMGGMFGQQSEISAEAWTAMVQEDFDISAGAQFSAYGITASADFMTEEQKKMAEEFSSKASKQEIYTIGAPPPADNNIHTWIKETKTAPAPMVLKLSSILELLDGYHGVEVSSAVQANMKRALDEYCGSLVDSGDVTTCEAPGPDPPFPSPPKKRTWHEWATTGSGNTNPVKECEEGEYVDQMIWIMDSDNINLSPSIPGFPAMQDLMFRCSDGQQYTMNHHQDSDHFDRAMTCEGIPGGFRQMSAMDVDMPPWGIQLINVRSFCLNEETQQTSNDISTSGWNAERSCDDNQQIVGFEARFDSTSRHIDNFRFECA